MLQRLPPRRVSAALEAIAVLVAIIGLQFALASESRRPAMRDFRVVYCGERAVRAHADPYRVEPLRSCERATKPAIGDAPWMVTPYPLPGYAAALFLPLGFLPFPIAEFVWLGGLTLAFAIVAVVLSEIISARSWAIALALAPTLGLLNMYYGEPVDLTIAACCIAGACVASDRPGAAAVAAAFTMIEPHIGLPACLGLFVFSARSRIVLVAMGVAFAIASFAALGLQTNVEYFAAFLPLQAHAELFAPDQYSLTRVLFEAGADPRTALLAGTLSYGAAIVAGLLAARTLLALGLSRSLAVFLPVAVAMFGGTFVHDVEIAAALPAAIVLAPRAALARVAVSLLAMQWGYPFRNAAGLLATATLGVASFALPNANVARRIAYVVCAFVVLTLIAIPIVPHVHAHVLRGQPGVPITPTSLAPIAWEWSIRLLPVSFEFDPGQIWLKVPSWLGLAAIPLSAIELLVRRKRESARAPS